MPRMLAVLDFPIAAVDFTVTIRQVRAHLITAARREPMKKIQLIAFVAVTTSLLAPAAHAQDVGDVMLTRMVSWFTGDASVGCDPSCGAPSCGVPSCSDPASMLASNFAEDTCCADGTCGCCSQCSRRHDVWGSVEFLMWWGRGTSLPPLVTTSPVNTPQATAGVLGQPTTSILFGDQLGGNKLRGGGRITAGIWLDPEHNVAAGGRFFGLGGDTTRFSQSSTGNPILARPFFNATLNQEDALLVAYPGLSQGNISAHLSTNNIIGAEAFTEIMMVRDANRRVDLVGGYQFFRLDDWLQIDNNSAVSGSGGLQIGVSDRFSTHNQFHGGEFGLRGRMARGMWSLNVLGLLGLGNMNEQVTINGSTTTSLGGSSVTNTGGLLTQPSNIGTYQRNRFAFIPQLTANLNYHLTQNLSFHIGYNIIWLSNIATSADQIDHVVNLTQPNGPARPAFTFNDREYWLQGINWGMNWDF